MYTRFRTTIAVASLATFVAIVAGSAEKRAAVVATSAPTSAPSAKVTIDNFSFTPAELTITAGQTVTWINHDDVPHTVISRKPDRSLKSDALDTDETYKHTFATAGTYDYFCSVHPHMTGRVIVKPAERKN